MDCPLSLVGSSIFGSPCHFCVVHLFSMGSALGFYLSNTLRIMSPLVFSRPGHFRFMHLLSVRSTLGIHLCGMLSILGLLRSKPRRFGHSCIVHFLHMRLAGLIALRRG